MFVTDPLFLPLSLLVGLLLEVCDNGPNAHKTCWKCAAHYLMVNPIFETDNMRSEPLPFSCVIQDGD